MVLWLLLWLLRIDREVLWLLRIDREGIARVGVTRLCMFVVMYVMYVCLYLPTLSNYSLLYHRWVICRDWEQVSNAGEGGGLTVGFVGVQVRKWKDGE